MNAVETKVQRVETNLMAAVESKIKSVEANMTSMMKAVEVEMTASSAKLDELKQMILDSAVQASDVRVCDDA